MIANGLHRQKSSATQLPGGEKNRELATRDCFSLEPPCRLLARCEIVCQASALLMGCVRKVTGAGQMDGLGTLGAFFFFVGCILRGSNKNS